MERIIKFVWEFRGADALGTAKHHVIHLKDYAQKEGFSFYESDIEEHTSMFVEAFFKIEEPDAKKCYDFLKPNRAEIVK